MGWGSFEKALEIDPNNGGQAKNEGGQVQSSYYTNSAQIADPTHPEKD